MGSCRNDHPCQMEVYYGTTFSTSASDIICYLYTYGLETLSTCIPRENEENSQIIAEVDQCPGDFRGIIGQDPNFSNSNRVYVTIFQFSLLIKGIFHTFL